MKYKITKLITTLFLTLMSFKFTCFSLDKFEIIVGLDVNVPPMGFLDASGNIVGFDIDLAKEVLESIGKNVKFQPIDWNSKELELNGGNIDVIWNGLSKTPEREKSMLLTKPYMKNRQIVIARSDSSINTLQDLESKNICVQKGSTGSEAINKHAIQKSLKSIIELDNMVNCLNEVEARISDATVVDEVIAKYYLSKENLQNKFKILDEEISSEYYVIAVKKGNTELKNQIEEQLETLNSSGKGAKISNKWFSENIFSYEEGSSEYTTGINPKTDDIIPLFTKGILNTFILFFTVIALSLPLGLLLCIIKIYGNRLANFLISLYINVMRGTPLLLQLLFIFYGLPYMPVIGNYLSFKDRFLAGTVAFILNYSAYFAEIFRGGFLSIDKGQIEACRVLGFSKTQELYKILIPQIFKVTLPSICNETVTLVKDTSLIYAIGVPELLSNTKNIVNSTANIFPYIIAGLMYLIACFLVTGIFKKFEKNISF